MAGWRRPSNDKVHSDGIIEKGVSARWSGQTDDKKLSRYLNEPPARLMSDALKRQRTEKPAMPAMRESDGAKKRYAPKVIERGVRP